MSEKYFLCTIGLFPTTLIQVLRQQIMRGNEGVKSCFDIAGTEGIYNLRKPTDIILERSLHEKLLSEENKYSLKFVGTGRRHSLVLILNITQLKLEVTTYLV